MSSGYAIPLFFILISACVVFLLYSVISDAQAEFQNEINLLCEKYDGKLINGFQSFFSYYNQDCLINNHVCEDKECINNQLIIKLLEEHT